jgi:Domain of unknown function (DUF5069)
VTGRAVPRRWSDELDGIRWLPRLIDKAKMDGGGALGAYLFGHSPIDKALLARLGVTTDEFAAIVRDAHDDGAIIEALRKRGFDEARVRRWSDRFPRTYRIFLRIWDVDDGYAAPTWFERGCLRLFRATEGGLMGLVRLVSPAP